MKDARSVKRARSGKSESTPRKDEQVLYIGPEENVTDVRQRLDHIAVQHVTLVVPSQTLLRGQITWKLLYARAKELGQDVCVVSSDPYVRAMAQSVHFHVAASVPDSKVS